MKDDETAYPGRGRNYYILASMHYNDAALDSEVESFGQRFRQGLRTGSEKKECSLGFAEMLGSGCHGHASEAKTEEEKEGVRTSVYANFASGDEKAEHMYVGKERVERLRALKRVWDPRGMFSCHNPVC